MGFVCTRMNGSWIPDGTTPTAALAALRWSNAWYDLYCSTSSRRYAFFFSMLACARAFSARKVSRSSCFAVAGKPFHVISFFSFEIMSIAMRTLRASYTRRRMFFSSYAWSAQNFGSSGLENSATSSSATSLYVVVPLLSTFSQTFMEKCLRPLPPFSFSAVFIPPVLGPGVLPAPWEVRRRFAAELGSGVGVTAAPAEARPVAGGGDVGSPPFSSPLSDTTWVKEFVGWCEKSEQTSERTREVRTSVSSRVWGRVRDG